MDLRVLAKDTLKAAQMMPVVCQLGSERFVAGRVNTDTVGNQYIPGGLLETFRGVIIIPIYQNVNPTQGQDITCDGTAFRIGPVKPRPTGDGWLVEIHAPEEP